jgi:hypothetical protein
MVEAARDGGGSAHGEEETGCEAVSILGHRGLTQEKAQVKNFQGHHLRRASSRVVPRERGKQRFPRRPLRRGAALKTQAPACGQSHRPSPRQKQKATSGSYPGWGAPTPARTSLTTHRPEPVKDGHKPPALDRTQAANPNPAPARAPHPHSARQSGARARNTRPAPPDPLVRESGTSQDTPSQKPDTGPIQGQNGRHTMTTRVFGKSP